MRFMGINFMGVLFLSEFFYITAIQGSLIP
jgi:hypothetical protein